MTGTTTRLAGAERIETASVIAQGQWDGSASLVVLARSDVPADALAATPLAAGAGPVLLSRVDALPADTAREIERALSPDGAQVATAWVVAHGDDVVVLSGARTRERLQESLGAAEVHLDEAALAHIADAVPADAVAGARYPEPQMAALDSER